MKWRHETSWDDSRKATAARVSWTMERMQEMWSHGPKRKGLSCILGWMGDTGKYRVGDWISQKIRTGALFFEKHLLLLLDTGKRLEADCLVVGTRGIDIEMASIFKAMNQTGSHSKLVSMEERRGLRTELQETPYVETKKGWEKKAERSGQGSKKKGRRNASVTEEACEGGMSRGQLVAAYNRTEEWIPPRWPWARQCTGLGWLEQDQPQRGLSEVQEEWKRKKGKMIV